MEMQNDYKGIKMYARSKSALNSFTFELARRLKGDGVTVNCIHPGVVRSNFPATALFPMAATFRPFFSSPQKGAKGIVHLATSEDLADVSGAYFVTRKRAEASEVSRRIDTAERLYCLTSKQVGLNQN